MLLQFIPARGRKRAGRHQHRGAYLGRLQFIPARGRKPFSLKICTDWMDAVAIYPREGTETPFVPGTYMVTRCCNLSPRGDGNISSSDSINVRLLVGCNLSPRGDGNREVMRQAEREYVAIYPREGTETISKSHIASPLWLQFIPARGRKPTHQHHWFCRHPPVAIYPREGTETCSHQRARSIPDCCNLSPRGDGNGHGGLIGCIGHRCNLSPRGDGNVERQRFSHDFRVAIYPREGTETQTCSHTCG